MSTSSAPRWADRLTASTTRLAAVGEARRLRRLERVRSIADLREAARRSLPPMIFDFIDGGAEDEDTVRGNESAFADWWFRPRILEDVAARSQAVEVGGQTLRCPIVLAPAGLAGLAWPRGEIHAAVAAAAFDVPFAVSTMSSCSIEDVRAATDGALWLQLYLWRDRDATDALVDRAAKHGYEALCLTVDVPVTGQRERDLRNGMTIPPRIGLRNSLGVVSRPGWMLRVGPSGVTFANVTDHGSGGTMALGAYVNSQLNPSATWDDLRRLRERWSGQLLVKGVLDPEAAGRLVDEGVDAVIVSNHGGRQLDGAVPALHALPGVVDAVGGRADVLLDGGVRRGTDVVKAVALGAKACLVGRPYVFGLGVAGEAGVSRALSILESEIDRTLALLGTRDIDDVRGDAARLLIRRHP
jgi:isopentenyl diphosphate isomerase/L-lactate dehydrogenase-like FMN-dependent dehydrogenase